MTELDQIITLHEKLIYKIALRFYDVPKEDLYQAGVIGLIKAYNNFKPSGETKFTTYAYNYIFGEMYELQNSLRTIKLNKNILSLYKKIEKTKYLLAQRLGHLPSMGEIAQYLEIDELVIAQVYASTNSIMSLDSETERPLYETVRDSKQEIDDKVIDLQASLETLNDEERKIIGYRYFKDLTQSETAQILGMSQVSVSRSEKKCLTKMYNYLKN